MANKSTVSVRIRGQEFRIRSDDDEESLQRIAGYLDDTMKTVEKRTGTVDSLDVALLTALNLARELVRLREDRALVETATPPRLPCSITVSNLAALSEGGEAAA